MCKAARAPVIYHYRPSPRLVFCGWTPFPTLSISDAERRAYHKRRVSDAHYPQRIFDTLWILVRSAPMAGRTKARPYNHLTIYTITAHWRQITASSDAEYPQSPRLRRFASSSYLRHDDDVHPSTRPHAPIASAKVFL